MKRGQEVYFISKGVVRKGVIYKQNMNTADILYKKGNYKRMYTFKRTELAVEIEGGTDGVQGSSKSGAVESNKGRNTKDSLICKNGQDKGNQVFVVAWRIRNMA